MLYLQRQVPGIFSVYGKDPPANGIKATKLDQHEMSASTTSALTRKRSEQEESAPGRKTTHKYVEATHVSASVNKLSNVCSEKRYLFYFLWQNQTSHSASYKLNSNDRRLPCYIPLIWKEVWETSRVSEQLS